MLTVYPNPAVDYLYINLGVGNEQSGQLVFIDLSGKEVLTQELEPGFSLYRMDVSHLGEGMYMIYLKESGLIKGRSKVILTR